MTRRRLTACGPDSYGMDTAAGGQQPGFSERFWYKWLRLLETMAAKHRGTYAAMAA